MSGYSIKARPVTEDGHTFDSILERDWAGFLTHIGLRWKHDCHALRSPGGRTTLANIVARPEFWLQETAVHFECKPSPSHVWDNEDHWRLEVETDGRPVVVTEGPPRPVANRELRARTDTHARVLVSLMDSVFDGDPTVDDVWHAPDLHVFMENGYHRAWIAQCPDCHHFGLWAPDLELHPEEPTLRTGLWLSACSHRPRMSVATLTRAISAPWLWHPRYRAWIESQPRDLGDVA